VLLDGSSLTISSVHKVAREFARVEISPSAVQAVANGRKAVERILKSGVVAYGINTGFGKLADARIEKQELDKLQLNLIRSHAVGTGEPIPQDYARAMMLVRLNSLLRGNSGVRVEIIRILQEFLNQKIYPFIPRFGSLGASGDLAPSAHLGLCLIGEGFVFDETTGEKTETAKVLKAKGIRKVSLRAKEGLAIINGTQLMTGYGALLVHDSINLLDNLDIAAAMTLEALGASLSSFDSRIHDLRPMHGQSHVAARILELVQDSEFIGTSSHVQDPYSLRCVPQVHGAFYDALDYVRKVIEIELNSVTDNPIIFPEKDEVVSAGNFHGQPVALALDILSLVLAEESIFSERRIDKLLSGHNSKLPLFLSQDPGLNSGLMVTQYTAAALVAENRILGSPSGLSNANVSAGQEDHASMGATAALKAKEALAHATKVVAMELLCACQALDILQNNNDNRKLGKGTAIALKQLRKFSSKVSSDRSLYSDVEKVSNFLQSGKLTQEIQKVLPNFSQ
jgi:histidine ammonia-lyase